MMEILFFAALTGYMIFRLWTVLGKRDGFEAPPTSQQDTKASDNVIPLPVRPSMRSVKSVSMSEEADTPIDLKPSIQEGLKKIQAVDPAFQLDHFLNGAVTAFEMIVEAFAKGDKSSLKPLLSPGVFKSFVSALQDREEAGQTVETKIVDLKDPEVVDIEIKGKQEQITLKFVSEQIVVTKDAEGKIQDNPAHLTLTMNDIWTFSRPIGSENPNWVLIATRIEGN
ncbi:MAG: Tim44/TimA family putative adaptor protein [Alphaproteobacteria bacterium]|jgi:predicted lipid-binding transport protein (Tim44 family)|nr:Tim44/TimA family putative adaptor protein [Alphaproteobacteria bacterium]